MGRSRSPLAEVSAAASYTVDGEDETAVVIDCDVAETRKAAVGGCDETIRTSCKPPTWIMVGSVGPVSNVAWKDEVEVIRWDVALSIEMKHG